MLEPIRTRDSPNTFWLAFLATECGNMFAHTSDGKLRQQLVLQLTSNITLYVVQSSRHLRTHWVLVGILEV